MSTYDVTAANTNRIVRFIVEPSNVADVDAAIFGILKGPATQYPQYGRLTTTPTANQNLAQLRTSLVARALSAYAILVGVQLANDSVGTGGVTAITAPALILSFEVDSQGEFFNNAWTGNVTLPKHKVTAITDTLGVGGMTTPKTKLGLQGLLDTLATVSYDGGTTGPFGTKSATGAIVLPDGSTTAGAPNLSTAAGITSGLKVTYLA